MQTIEELLSSQPFFAGLDADAMRLIAGCASNVHFAAGETIFGEGEEASHFYMLRHGRVALEVHSPARGPLVIDSMDQGEVLGWSWLVPPYRYFCGARAVTPVSATVLDGACLRGKCEANPELGSAAEAGGRHHVPAPAVPADPAARPVREGIRGDLTPPSTGTGRRIPRRPAGLRRPLRRNP